MSDKNEVEKLVKYLEKCKAFSIKIAQVQFEKDRSTIILKETASFPKRKYPRRIIVSICKNQFSISSYEIHNNGYQDQKFTHIYTSTVKGGISSLLIVKELKSIIYGKDKTIFSPHNSFELRLP